MRVLAISYFDPASVVLSHRDLMRAVGHDFRLAVVRAYTERQQQADYVCERLVRRVEDVVPGVSKTQVFWEKLSPDLEALREFASQADVIQFHLGIGHGDGDWASTGEGFQDPHTECADVAGALNLKYPLFGRNGRASHVAFIHGSNSAWRNRLKIGSAMRRGSYLATSTIDYATELDAVYLPPLVDVGTKDVFTAINPDGSSLDTFDTEEEAQKAHPNKGVVATPVPLRAKLRGDDDPLLIAHTPTDRMACQTEEFLKAAQGLGIPVRLGEGLSHSSVLQLKAECNAGFDHLRGAFSTNTLENAALGLVPLFALKPNYLDRLQQEGVEPPPHHSVLDRPIWDSASLPFAIRDLSHSSALTRTAQDASYRWWETYFSAGPITERLVKFYESL